MQGFTPKMLGITVLWISNQVCRFNTFRKQHFYLCTLPAMWHILLWVYTRHATTVRLGMRTEVTCLHKGISNCQCLFRQTVPSAANTRQCFTIYCCFIKQRALFYGNDFDNDIIVIIIFTFALLIITITSAHCVNFNINNVHQYFHYHCRNLSPHTT